MKKFIIIGLVLSGWIAGAQEVYPPAEVSNSFASKYPKAEDVYWYEDVIPYEVSFFNNDATHNGLFDEKGTWLETRTFYSIEDLNPKIVSACEQKFPDAELSTAEFIETQTESFFEITMETNAISYLIKIKADGKITDVKKTSYD